MYIWKETIYENIIWGKLHVKIKKNFYFFFSEFQANLELDGRDFQLIPDDMNKSAFSLPFLGLPEDLFIIIKFIFYLFIKLNY